MKPELRKSCQVREGTPGEGEGEEVETGLQFQSLPSN